MTYIAEDVPWYMVDKDEDAPWRGEDIATSAPRVIYRGPSERKAREKMAFRLIEISDMEHVQRSGESNMYVAAATFILYGGNGVRISGRYYRIWGV